ncbi:MAG: hypothetical protein AABY22_08235, partial [Nanoarchaeota archaeon]
MNRRGETTYEEGRGLDNNNNGGGNNEKENDDDSDYIDDDDDDNSSDDDGTETDEDDEGSVSTGQMSMSVCSFDDEEEENVYDDNRVNFSQGGEKRIKKLKLSTAIIDHVKFNNIVEQEVVLKNVTVFFDFDHTLSVIHLHELKKHFKLDPMENVTKNEERFHEELFGGKERIKWLQKRIRQLLLSVSRIKLVILSFGVSEDIKNAVEWLGVSNCFCEIVGSIEGTKFNKIDYIRKYCEKDENARAIFVDDDRRNFFEPYSTSHEVNRKEIKYCGEEFTVLNLKTIKNEKEMIYFFTSGKKHIGGGLTEEEFRYLIRFAY